MSDKKTPSGKKQRPVLKWLAIIIILASFICSMWVNFGVRASAEADDRAIGLVIDYDELMRIADGSHNIDFADMLRKASLAGATGLVVRERILGEWEAAGDVLVLTGGQFAFHLENLYGESAEDILAGFATNSTFIISKNFQVHDQIMSMLEAKTRYPRSFTIPGYMCIAVQLHSSERGSLGLGFPLAQLELAAEAGFQIIPRLRNWEPLTEASLTATLRWVKMIRNLAAIGFNDPTVPGGGVNPIVQDRLADAIETLGVPLVSFEFYDQVGLSGLANRLDNQLLRAHAIAENELMRYMDFRVAMDRYSLAATERNIRYIYVRFHGLLNPAAAMEDSMEMITDIREGLEADGLIVGNPEPFPAYKIGTIPMFLLGAGVIAAGGWLFALVAEPFAKRKWFLPYGILVAFGLIGWGGLMYIAPTLSRKVLSLAGAIIFPSLSVMLILPRKNEPLALESGVRRTLRAIGQLIVISVITFAGSMISSAILSEPVFMLKLDSFFGVKISHVVPLVIVPVILWLREEDWYGIMAGTAKSSVKYWQLAIGVVLLAGFVIYILRTGNESPELVSGFEVRVRQVLKDILGVRPRTKEFLIGHPVMMITMYYGYKIGMFPLVMVGLVGQISIINTYAHLHTPLMVSLLRSANGLWIGIIVGVIAIAILECVHRRIKKLDIKYAGKRLSQT